MRGAFSAMRASMWLVAWRLSSLQRLNDQLEMNAVVLQIAGWMGHVIQRQPPVEFKARAIARQNIPAKPKPDTRQGLGVQRHTFRTPCSSEIHKLGKLQEWVPGDVTHQGKARFDRGKKGVVANKRIFAIPADAEPSPDRNLLKWKQSIVRELEAHLPKELHAPPVVKSPDRLDLSQPGEE